MSICCSTQDLSIEDTQSKVVPQRPAIFSTFKNVDSGSGTSLIRDYIRGLLNRYALRRQQKIDRDAFSMMLSLNDELLKDIGVTRGDVTWAANLPLSEDAATVLRQRTVKGAR